MIPYKQLYAFLCAKQSDAIDLLESGHIQDAEMLLKQSLLEVRSATSPRKSRRRAPATEHFSDVGKQVRMG